MNTDDLIRFLDTYARSKGIKPVDAFYITGEIRVRLGEELLYSNEGLEYCRPCADKFLASAYLFLPADKRDDHFVCAIDLTHDDTCKQCYICGALLYYTLNKLGVESELDHYHGLRFRKPLHPGDAFHIARVIEAAPGNPAAVALAKRAARKAGAA